MRSLSANALAKISITHGNEPVTIIEVDWITDDGAKVYADRDIGAIQGKILEVGDLDNVISVSNNDSSQELPLTLDDTDGTIKAILDTTDVHKRSARVYQWFEGMDLADKFLLFAGKVSSPITWDERQRTVSFTIISQLEDKEIGFSAEEGEFEWIPKDLIDKAWPMIFGKVQDVPCMQFNQAVAGSTLCGVGVVSGKDYSDAYGLGGNDIDFYIQMAAISAQITHAGNVAIAYGSSLTRGADKAVEAAQQQQALANQRAQLDFQHWKNEVCAEWQKIKNNNNPEDGGCNPVRILGGEDFPQDIGITIRIGQGIFTGHFIDDLFYITDRLHEDNETKAQKAYEGSSTDVQDILRNINARTYPRLSQLLVMRPLAYGSVEDLCTASTDTIPTSYAWSFKTDVDGREIKTVTSMSVYPPAQSSVRNPQRIAQHYWAEAGSTVVVHSGEPITYVASIVPGTVLAVKAYKDFDNQRKLLNVPDDLYTITTQNYGPITAVQIVFDKPLSTIAEQGWDDNIYVTFESDIGPHTVDILEYIIENYTDLDFDTTSFTAIRSNLDPFPMNFPILEKKNALTVLQEIAFQARCALWISNGVFYIKYLPEEPSSDSTITVSDIDAENGIKVELTPTEDLVTKMIVTWRINWSEDDPDKVILRHNVKKYGTQTEEIFFYCFNQPDIVLKAATFWLIRKSNTWKKIKFKTYLQKLNLETFDTVTLNFTQGYVATGSVKAIVEEATYNSNSQLIEFVCHTPVKSGDMVKYEFFWPSQLSVTEKFPTDDERDAGYAGGDGIGSGASGELPIGYTDPDDWGSGIIWVGGPNVVFSGPADYGERYPTDIDFVAQPVIVTNQYAELDVSPNPSPNLDQIYKNDTSVGTLAEMKLDRTPIDIRTTGIIDSDEPDGPITYLETLIKKIVEDSGIAKLVVDCDESLWGNEENEEGKPFDFKYDDEGGKFGAGTAWLKDN